MMRFLKLESCNQMVLDFHLLVLCACVGANAFPATPQQLPSYLECVVSPFGQKSRVIALLENVPAPAKAVAHAFGLTLF